MFFVSPALIIILSLFDCIIRSGIVGILVVNVELSCTILLTSIIKGNFWLLNWFDSFFNNDSFIDMLLYVLDWLSKIIKLLYIKSI